MSKPSPKWTSNATILSVALVVAIGGAGLLWSLAGAGSRAAPPSVVPAGGRAEAAPATPAAGPPVSQATGNRPDPQAASVRVSDEIFKQIGVAETITAEHATRLEQYAAKTDTTEDLILARSAMAVAADRLKRATMTADVRARLERLVVGTLTHKNWHVRLTGLSVVREADLLDRPDVAAKVQALRHDPEDRVARRAKLVRVPGEPPLGESPLGEAPAKGG